MPTKRTVSLFFCLSAPSDHGAQTCVKAPVHWCVCPSNMMTAHAWEQWGGWCWSHSTSSSPVGPGGPGSRISPEWTSGVGGLQVFSYVVKVSINIAITSVHYYLLFLLQGKISRMVQQGFWSPVCEWSPEHPLLFSPARSDEHRGQDLNPRYQALSWVTLPEQLDLRTSDPGGESSRQWTLVSFHAAENKKSGWL